MESRASIESRVVQCVVKDSLRGPRAGEIESETACWHGAFGERAPDPQGANRPRFGNLVLHRVGRGEDGEALAGGDSPGVVGVRAKALKLLEVEHLDGAGQDQDQAEALAQDKVRLACF